MVVPTQNKNPCFDQPFNTVNPSNVILSSNSTEVTDSTNIPNTICVDVVDIEVNLADKYKFPAKDKIRPDSYTKTFNAVECLQHVIKLSACQLDNEHLEFWNSVALRDCQYLELSECGIQSTKFDIREQLSIFKKNSAKVDYVNRLKTLGLSKIDNSNKNKEGKKADVAVNLISTEFLQYSLNDITKIFYKNPDGLLPLLQDILGNPNLNKKSRKKVIRFEKLISNKNKLILPRLIFI